MFSSARTRRSVSQSASYTPGTTTHLSNFTGTSPGQSGIAPPGVTPGAVSTPGITPVTGPVAKPEQSLRPGQAPQQGQPPKPGVSGAAGGQAAGKGGVSGRGLVSGPGAAAAAGRAAEVGGRMPGGSSGVLAGEQQAARDASTGVQGGRGTSAPGAAGGMAAGAGKGGEDEEYQRKIMVEVDADELFGLDTLVAPPNIGE